MELPCEQATAISATTADHHERIRQVLRYISDHLDNGLPLEDLAAIACYSPYHFHRIFSAFVGEPVAAYVRRKRLEKGALEIVRTNRPITEIALAAGFETPTAFTKAFKRTFGTTPSALRKAGHRDDISRFIQPLSINLPEANMTPEIRDLGSFTVMQATARGLVNHTFTQAAQRAFGLLQRYCLRHDLRGATGRCFGIMPDDPSTTPAEECRFQAALELREELEIPADEGVELLHVYAGRCAVFLDRGP